MKKYLYTILMFFFSTVIYFIISSCDMKSPVENVKVIFNSRPISTVISGNIVDAATGEPIQGQIVYLTIEGANKNDIADLTGTSKTEFNTNVGFVDFALTESVTPSETSPVKIVIVARCDGFMTTNLPLRIYKTGSTNFTINMVNQNNLPKGVASAKANGNADNSGIVQNDFNVTVNEPQANVNATMLIPKGTVLYDANGNPLKGNITASITYFNNQNEEALRSFPGGFTVTTKKSGIQSEGVFYTAGFFNLTIKDASGKEAKSIGKRKLFKSTVDDTFIIMTAEIPSGTINPETNAEVKAGDSISVWSIDSVSSIWTHEKKAVVQGPNANGKYFVQFLIDHLSYWNIDWQGARCGAGVTIRIIGKPEGYPIGICVYSLAGGFSRCTTITANQFQIGEAPYNQRMKIIAYDKGYCGGGEIGSVIVDDLCALIVVDLYVTLSPPPSTDVIVNAEGFCPCDTNLIVRPNGNPIWYRIYGTCNSNWVYAGTVSNGSITIPGIFLGSRYIYATWYEGEWYAIGAIVYEDHAEIDPGLSTENIVYSEIIIKDNYTILKFKGQLSDRICVDLCK